MNLLENPKICGSCKHSKPVEVSPVPGVTKLTYLPTCGRTNDSGYFPDPCITGNFEPMSNLTKLQQISSDSGEVF